MEETHHGNIEISHCRYKC